MTRIDDDENNESTASEKFKCRVREGNVFRNFLAIDESSLAMVGSWAVCGLLLLIEDYYYDKYDQTCIFFAFIDDDGNLGSRSSKNAELFRGGEEEKVCH